MDGALRRMMVSLVACPHIERYVLRRTLQSDTDVERLWSAPLEHLSGKLRRPEPIASVLQDWKARVQGHALEERLAQKGIHVLLKADDAYPTSLLDLPEPPVAIFAVGQEVPRAPSVAVVGTRRASGYGLEASAWIAETLASSGVTIVSGLALGIDGAAHQGALGTNGPTVAVMACGPDKCYPAAHRLLWSNIQRQGAIYSEYAPGTPIAKYRFPERNRLIAALSSSIVVVQAGEKSGALGTAECGLDIGREIYVVPGPITSVHHRGAHRLLQDGARILLDPMEILRDLGVKEPRGTNHALVPERWVGLYDALIHCKSASQLSDVLQVPIAHVYSGLLELELAGFVVRVPGGTYERAANKKGMQKL